MKPVPDASAAPADLDGLLIRMRPKLHRYCARMTGSVIDGEDVLQDALIKAVESLASSGGIGNPEGWLFRIAHNTALDFLRRRNRQEAFRSGEEVDMIADPADTVLNREIAGASLRTFMRLPVAQRSSVILMDVLGCSLQEVCEVMEFSLPAVKAALHRGRTQLRELADQPDDLPHPKMSESERDRLGAYVTHFNAPGFRRDPRHDSGRCASRPRQQDAPERQGRGFQIFRKLFEDQRLASGAGVGRPAPRHPGVRSQRAGLAPEIFHAAAVVCG